MKNVRVAAVLLVVAALAAVFWWSSPRGAAPTPAAEPVPTSPQVPRSALTSFALIPSVDDRFVSEPCSRITGGGLYSLAALLGEMEKQIPGVIGVSMGDATQSFGGVGRRVSWHVFSEVFPLSGVSYVAAGEGELGLGVDFLRETLTRNTSISFLCANAADPGGLTLLRGWALLKSGDRGVLLVAVAADSLQAELRRRGSNVLLLPAAECAAKARADAMRQASLTGPPIDITVLLVHGTVDETAAILEKTPGATFAVAAHGTAMPDADPRRVGGVPIFYGGQGLRFAWRVLVPGGHPPISSLTRFGMDRIVKGSPYGEALKSLRESMTRTDFELAVNTAGERPRDPEGAYVGGTRCADCHIAVAARHSATKHGVPSKALLDSPFAASTECIACHVTAPYWDGGWRGPKDRSDMAAVSCEACHGPGLAHAASPKTVRLRPVSMERCYECHLPDRTPGFDAEAAWKLVGHANSGR